jgi:hypothetical protein
MTFCRGFIGEPEGSVFKGALATGEFAGAAAPTGEGLAAGDADADGLAAGLADGLPEAEAGLAAGLAAAGFGAAAADVGCTAGALVGVAGAAEVQLVSTRQKPRARTPRGSRFIAPPFFEHVIRARQDRLERSLDHNLGLLHQPVC